jgi:hypothetical protein
VHLIDGFSILCELRLQSGPLLGGFRISGALAIATQAFLCRPGVRWTGFPLSEFRMPQDVRIERSAEDIQRRGYRAGQLRSPANATVAASGAPQSQSCSSSWA